MDASNTRVLILQNLMIYCFILRTGCEEKCDFPSFLFASSQQGDLSDTGKAWYTETLFIANSKAWERRLKIVVKPKSFTTSSEIPWICDNPHLYNNVQHEYNLCVKSEALTYTKCVAPEGYNLYRVLEAHVHSGKETFYCIEFVPRSENVIEMKYSKPLDGDPSNDCSDALMTKKDWPWIAADLSLPVTCPVVGGFDFETYFNSKDKKFCPRTWRPSRLESECRLGEGIQFLFPDKACSFFHHRSLEVTVVCWASWQEKDEFYIIASEKGNYPQFSLVLPSRYIDTYPRQTGYLSFSPVFTKVSNRKHSTTDMYRDIHLQLRRSATESCFDESVACEEFASAGKCSNEGFAYYGNYCKKSCGFCECKFPALYQGDWILFETDHKESVNIRGGTLTFSKMGAFICKGKHWSKPYYKLLSLYNNGCRPKFTCIQLKFNEEDGFLRLSLSESTTQDQSFDLCDSKEEESPKILYPTSRISLLDCGLGGLIEIQALLTPADSCRGTLSDWNPFSCSVVPTLTLALRSCEKGHSQMRREFLCEALVHMKDDYSVLLTKQMHMSPVLQSNYQCWIIKTSGSYNSSRTVKSVPWQHAYMLTRAQCGGDSDLDPEVYKPTQAILQIYPDNINKDCIAMQKPGSGKYSATGQQHTGSKLYDSLSHPHKSPTNQGTGIYNRNLHAFVILLICLILA